MTSEVLDPQDWGWLKEVFVSEFGTDEMPDPRRTEIRVLWGDDGEIAAFYLTEVVKHAGPFWVREQDRGKGLARQMAEEALALAEGQEGYIAATVPAVEHLAESLGLVRVRGSLWCKEA